MPRAKEHFIIGACVAVVLDVLKQRVQMALDPEREFEWAEFGAVGAAGGLIGVAADVLCDQPNTTRLVPQPDVRRRGFVCRPWAAHRRMGSGNAVRRRDCMLVLSLPPRGGRGDAQRNRTVLILSMHCLGFRLAK